MSENRELNGGEPADIERTLRTLVPAPLNFEREDLFFRAGVALGHARQSPQMIWPSIAAALAVLCAGLGTTVYHQSSELRLASDSHGRPSTIAQSVEVPAANRSDLKSFSTSATETALARLASPAPLEPGRLTAAGWIVTSPDERDDSTQTDRQSPPQTRQPRNYRDLLQTELEG